jgi:hypothetical protein
MSGLKVYTPEDLERITGTLFAKVKGDVTGVSSIHRVRGFFNSLLKLEEIGFYLNKSLFCLYRCPGDSDKIIRTSAWLNQNMGQELYIDGTYYSYHKLLLVLDFYADSAFKNKIIKYIPE